jgi:hypothetical protein
MTARIKKLAFDALALLGSGLLGFALVFALAGAATSESMGGDHAPSIFGNLKVVEADTLVDHNNQPLLGAYDYETRTVFVLKKLKGRWRQAVIYHEACHASLEDHNLHARIPPPAEEEICDAIGNSWAAHK